MTYAPWFQRHPCCAKGRLALPTPRGTYEKPVRGMDGDADFTRFNLDADATRTPGIFRRAAQGRQGFGAARATFAGVAFSRHRPDVSEVRDE